MAARDAVATSTPRTEMKRRLEFAAAHDPWAARVKEDSLKARQEESSARERVMSKREHHRRQLEEQIELRRAEKEEEKRRLRREADELAVTARSYRDSKAQHKERERLKHRAEARTIEEQMREIDEQRRRQQAAAEAEAKALHDSAIAELEEEKSRIRARRRQKQEEMQQAAAMNSTLRRQKAAERRTEHERDVELMNDYKKVMEEQEMRRTATLERHKHRAPVPLFASADRFEAPKYQAYFHGVDEAAKKKIEDDAQRDELRMQKAKDLADECARDIEEQISARQKAKKKRDAEAARERVSAEADANTFNSSVSRQRQRKREKMLTYREELEKQMIEAEARRLRDLSNGGLPSTARF